MKKKQKAFEIRIFFITNLSFEKKDSFDKVQRRPVFYVSNSDLRPVSLKKKFASLTDKVTPKKSPGVYTYSRTYTLSPKVGRKYYSGLYTLHNALSASRMQGAHILKFTFCVNACRELIS